MSDKPINRQNPQVHDAKWLSQAQNAAEQSKNNNIVTFSNGRYLVINKSVRFWTGTDSNKPAYDVKNELNSRMTAAFKDLGLHGIDAEKRSIEILKKHYVRKKNKNADTFLEKKEIIKSDKLKNLLADFRKEVNKINKNNNIINNNNNNNNGGGVSDSEEIFAMSKDEDVVTQGGDIKVEEGPYDDEGLIEEPGQSKKDEKLANNRATKLEGIREPKKPLPEFKRRKKGLPPQNSSFYQAKRGVEFANVLNDMEKRGVEDDYLKALQQQMSLISTKSDSMKVAKQKFENIPTVKSKVENNNNDKDSDDLEFLLSPDFDLPFENDYEGDNYNNNNNNNNDLTPGNTPGGDVENGGTSTLGDGTRVVHTKGQGHEDLSDTKKDIENSSNNNNNNNNNNDLTSGNTSGKTSGNTKGNV